MVAVISRSESDEDIDPMLDQRVVLHGMSWKDYEVMLAVRGDRAGVRMYYLEGELELMSPSHGHESLKTTLGRLLEAWADERGVELNGLGSWTLRSLQSESGAEPDECYVLDAPTKDVPDLAIEVAWTRGGLNKLAIYRGLGVPEVWILDRKHRLQVHVLGAEGYERAATSKLLPDLDLDWLVGFLSAPSQSQATRALRAAMRR